MGWDIQINPTAEAFGISHELAGLLDGFLEDFHLRYAALSPSPALIEALKTHVSRHTNDAHIVDLIVADLSRGDGVEADPRPLTATCGLRHAAARPIPSTRSLICNLRNLRNPYGP